MSSRTHYLVCLGVAIAVVQLVGCGDDCGRGTVENNGECVLIPAECGPGTSLAEGNVCVASRTGCGPFTALDPVTHQCVPSGSLCGAGTSFDEATRDCVPTTEVICGAGTVQQGRVCVLAFEPCVDGQVLLDEECVDGGAVQLIHNAPDPALAVVDIYVNDDLVADDVPFRTASAFLPFVANTELTVVIADSTSTDATPVSPGATTTLTIESGDRVAIIVGGVVNQGDFAPGVPALALDVLDVRSVAAPDVDADEYSFAFYNGAADVGPVSAAVDGQTAPGIPYGTLTPYLALPAGVSAISVNASALAAPRTFQTSAAGSAIAAPGGVNAGTALLALTSGFVDTAANQDGPAFTLVASLPSGGPLLVLDPAAQLQVVHNASSLGVADIYIDDVRISSNLDYRASTAFALVTSNTTVRIAAFPAGTTDISGTPPVALETTLTGNAIAVIDGDSLAPVVHLLNGARTSGATSDRASVAFYNGSEGSADFSVTSYGQPIFAATPSGTGTGYVELPATNWPLDINSSGTSFISIETSSPGFFPGLPAGSAWVLIATGRAAQQVSFALVPTTGGAFTFLNQAARAQIVHAAAFDEAALVDVYVGNRLAVNDMPYASASPFAGVPLNAPIDVLPATTGTTFGEALAPGNPPLMTTTTAPFNPGSSHYVVAAGGDLGGLALVTTPGAERASGTTFNDLRLVNAVADAPAVFQNEGSDTTTEVDDTTFGLAVASGAFSTITFNLPPQVYGVELTDTDQNPFTPRVRGNLDLSGPGGRIVFLVATGYATPPGGVTDRDIRLIAVLPDGSATELPDVP